MKRILSGIGTLLLCAVVTSLAQDMKISRVGAHGAYSIGGDIEESEAGFGAQAEFAINAKFSIEAALSRFGDEWDDMGITIDQDLTIGVSAVYRTPLMESIHGYLLGGVDYNITEVDASIDPAVYGISMNADVDADNEQGFHAGAGLNFPLQNNFELFTEYRYTFLEMEGDITASAMGKALTTSTEFDYNFGLLKVGANYLF